jgi:fatty-acyl-CoA synthase
MLDEAGMLFITGRASDMFISGGANIDPREVEEKILRHPSVCQAGVVGVPDSEWGEAGYAICVVDPGSGVTADALLAWCRDNMARYKVPKVIHLVDEMPTSTYGKVTAPILREALRAAGLWPEGIG